MRRQSFKAWLKAQGRFQQTAFWRYRHRSLPPAPSASSPPPVANPADALAAYAAHQKILRKQNARLAALMAGMALFGKTWIRAPEAESRQDARIAILLRAEGHEREAVLDAIRRCAPELHGRETRDWRRYAARTAAYAFGMAGDLELAKLQRLEVKPVEMPLPAVEPILLESAREAPRLRMR